jgi:hypothetical protein
MSAYDPKRTNSGVWHQPDLSEERAARVIVSVVACSKNFDSGCFDPLRVNDDRPLSSLNRRAERLTYSTVFHHIELRAELNPAQGHGAGSRLLRGLEATANSPAEFGKFIVEIYREVGQGDPGSQHQARVGPVVTARIFHSVLSANPSTRLV